MHCTALYTPRPATNSRQSFFEYYFLGIFLPLLDSDSEETDRNWGRERGVRHATKVTGRNPLPVATMWHVL